jgi:hypothetical protein
MGVLGDLLLLAMRVAPERRRRFLVFAAAWPGAAYTAYFVALVATRGVWWPTHVWTGAILLSATEGWLIGLLVLSGASIAAPRGA